MKPNDANRTYIEFGTRKKYSDNQSEDTTLQQDVLGAFAAFARPAPAAHR